MADRLTSLALSRGALALVMVVAGTLHFVATDAYVAVMPGYLPLHRELVYLSGVFEVLLRRPCSRKRLAGLAPKCCADKPSPAAGRFHRRPFSE